MSTPSAAASPVAPSAADDLDRSWNRVRGLAEKLTEAIDQFDDAGGIARLAPRFTPRTRAKGLAVLVEVRKALDGPVAALNAHHPLRTRPQTRPRTIVATPEPAESSSVAARSPEPARPAPLGGLRGRIHRRRS